MKKVYTILAALALIFTMSTCKKGDQPPTCDITQFNFSFDEYSIIIDEKLDLSKELKIQTNPAEAVASLSIKWDVNDASIAEITKEGVLKAKNPGTVTVTAQALTTTATCNVIIEKEPIIVTDMTITPSDDQELFIKEILQVDVKLDPSNANPNNINPDYPKECFNLIDRHQGSFTFAAIKKGEGTISFTYGDISKSFHVSVKENLVTKIEMDQQMITKGTTIKLNPKITLQYPDKPNSYPDLTYTVQPAENASVTSDGTATVNESCIIYAQYAHDTNVGIGVVIVALDPKPVESFTLAPEKTDYHFYEDVKVYIKDLTPSDADISTINFFSNRSDIVKFVSLNSDNKGRYALFSTTYPSSVIDDFTTTISGVAGSVSNNCDINVSRILPTHVNLTLENGGIAKMPANTADVATSIKVRYDNYFEPIGVHPTDPIRDIQFSAKKHISETEKIATDELTFSPTLMGDGSLNLSVICSNHNGGVYSIFANDVEAKIKIYPDFSSTKAADYLGFEGFNGMIGIEPEYDYYDFKDLVKFTNNVYYGTPRIKIIKIKSDNESLMREENYKGAPSLSFGMTKIGEPKLVNAIIRIKIDNLSTIGQIRGQFVVGTNDPVEVHFYKKDGGTDWAVVSADYTYKDGYKTYLKKNSKVRLFSVQYRRHLPGNKTQQTSLDSWLSNLDDEDYGIPDKSCVVIQRDANPANKDKEKMYIYLLSY